MAGGGLEAQPIHPGLWQEKLTSLVLKVFLAECFVLLAKTSALCHAEVNKL